MVLLLVAVATLVALGGAIAANLRALDRSVHWTTRKWYRSTTGQPDKALPQAQLTTRAS